MAEITGFHISDVTGAGEARDGEFAIVELQASNGEKSNFFFPYQKIAQLLAAVEQAADLAAKARVKKFGSAVAADQALGRKALQSPGWEIGPAWSDAKRKFDVLLTLKLGENIPLSVGLATAEAKHMGDSLLAAVDLANTAPPPKDH